MLQSIRLKNFFGFADETIDLHPQLNVLVGINGSGKTTLLRALQLLRAVARGDGIRQLFIEQWGGFHDVCNMATKDATEIVLEFVFGERLFPENDTGIKESSFRYSLVFRALPSQFNYALEEKIVQLSNTEPAIEYFSADSDHIQYINMVYEDKEKFITKQRNNSSRESSLQEAYYSSTIVEIILEYGKNINYYSEIHTSLDSRIRRPVPPDVAEVLEALGSNLPQVLNTLKINEREVYQHIKQRLQDVNPQFEDLEFANLGGNIWLTLEEKGLRRTVRPQHISDGTLRFLCMLAILCNPHRGSVVAIDEPETGLHPDMLAIIAEEIKEASQSSQFFIATHSEKILDRFDVENVLVFEKDESNQTSVKRFDTQSFGEWAQKYATGELWLNGDLGGTRW